jgi:hypothetical protein
MHSELERLDAGLAAVDRDAQTIVANVSDDCGRWRPTPHGWSLAQCFDHLATANRVYLGAMEAPVARARQEGRTRRRPPVPGLVGGWFVRRLEPPVTARRRLRAPRKIVPRPEPSLADAYAAFCASQQAVRTFLRDAADLDLAAIRFPNPFIRGIRFSVATGLHVIAAHDRRHLWQARQVREASERASDAKAVPP